MARPIVALVGRPNVGKSTLFNRLIGARLAVVHETPGTTHDRLYGEVDWRGRTFTVVDTGGIGMEDVDELGRSVVEQARTAMRESDVVVFLTDARSGPLPSDFEVADELRRSTKPLVLAANKADNPKDRSRVTDFSNWVSGNRSLCPQGGALGRETCWTRSSRPFLRRTPTKKSPIIWALQSLGAPTWARARC